MTSTDSAASVSGLHQEMDYQNLEPALLIASSLGLAIRAVRWNPTHSDGLANVDWDREVEHGVRIAKVVLSHLTIRSPEIFRRKLFLGTLGEVVAHLVRTHAPLEACLFDRPGVLSYYQVRTDVIRHQTFIVSHLSQRERSTLILKRFIAVAQERAFQLAELARVHRVDI